jgi:hypothetical protein
MTAPLDEAELAAIEERAAEVAANLADFPRPAGVDLNVRLVPDGDRLRCPNCGEFKRDAEERGE